MIDWLARLFETASFVPRNSCAGLSSSVVFWFVASDAAIALSYLVLSVAFAGWLRRRHDRSMWPVFWLLGLFVIFCGATHACGVLVMWVPVYRFILAVNIATALISVLAAGLTAWYTPRAMRVPSVKDIYDEFQAARRELNAELDQIAQDAEVDPDLARRKVKALRRRRSRA